MSNVSIRLEGVSISFPRTKVFLGSIEHSIRTFLNLRQTIQDSVIALDEVSLDIHDGEVVGVIGRNGSGKSTLLRVISGIYRPDEGKVLCKGKTSLLAGLGIGFNPNLTGRENVYLSSSIHGLSKVEVDSIMDSIIDFSGVGDFIDQPLRTFSAGMRARLGFAICSAIKPETLLIDEVLSVGDQEFREKSANRIKEMVKKARTVVLVSHNFNTLLEICNRMILVDKGKIKAVGEPQEIIDAYSELQ